MRFLKLFISLTLTILLIWALGRAWSLGEPAREVADEQGNKKMMPDTEQFIPPLGKLLSPSHGFWQNSEGQIPNFDGSLRADQLSAPIEVKYDDRMVPHIFAANLVDAAYAQGFVTASLRLWQMELQTHEAAGRLTEVFGTTQKIRDILLPKDKYTRRIGIPLGAERALEEWKKHPEFKTVQAYVDGINAYIETLSYHNKPLMYKLLNYEPEPWTALKCALLLKSMGRTLTSRNHDFELTNTLKVIGLNQFDKLFPDYFPQQSPIIQDSMKFAPVVVNQNDSINVYFGVPVTDSLPFEQNDPAPPKGIGSNNWAVAGSKTASGNAILCNDPHLFLNFPSLWFEIQIHTPQFNTYGASLPGAPGVISGFNQDIAWGVTNVSHDVMDWYAIEWQDDSKQAYWFDSTYRKASYRVEDIKIRGQQAIKDTIYITHMGPISHSEKGQDFALRWTLHDASAEPLTFIKLMKAKNYEDYKDAIQHFACPAQNIVFAATNGDIALWTQGKLPLRKKNQGKFVQYGTASSQLWQGYIPQPHIPHEYNPVRGFVGSANQHSIDPAIYPYEYFGYFEEYRGRYLNRKLAEMSNITVQDMQKLQYDSYSVKAEDGMALLNKYLQKGDLTKEELEIWHQLKDWDLYYRKEQTEPAIFEAWFEQLSPLIYDELEMVQDDKNSTKKHTLAKPEEHQLLHLLWSDTTNIIFDLVATPERENAPDILTLAFQKGCTKIPRDTISGKILSWQEVRNTSVQHLAKIKAFGDYEIPSDGHTSTLNALGSRPGPSWRMIVEMDKKQIKAYGVYPGGQSENPGSYYYDNMMDTWEKGKHFELLFMPDKSSHTDKIVFEQRFDN